MRLYRAVGLFPGPDVCAALGQSGEKRHPDHPQQASTPSHRCLCPRCHVHLGSECEDGE